jgi:hypothetical protein
MSECAETGVNGVVTIVYCVSERHIVSCTDFTGAMVESLRVMNWKYVARCELPPHLSSGQAKGNEVRTATHQAEIPTVHLHLNKQNKLRGLSPQTNYTG